MNSLVGLLVDPYKKNALKVTINNNWEDFAKTIGCQNIECVGRDFNGKRYAILCDEDGKLKPNQIVSIVTAQADTGAMIEYFVGKCLIFNIKNRGKEFKSITGYDMVNLRKCFMTVQQNGKPLNVLLCTL